MMGEEFIIGLKNPGVHVAWKSASYIHLAFSGVCATTACSNVLIFFGSCTCAKCVCYNINRLLTPVCG